MATTMSSASTSSTTPHGNHYSQPRQQRTTPGLRPSAARSGASSALLSPPAARTPADRTTKEPRQQSPSYFGLQIDSGQNSCGSNEGQNLRGNWSPPTSNVRSAAAASPRVIPLDQNPEFEAFRRQAEQRNAFNILKPSGSLSGMSAGSRTSSSDSGREAWPGQVAAAAHGPPMSREHSTASAKAAADERNLAPLQRSPKRLLSSPVAIVTDRPRRNSPASFNDREDDVMKQLAKYEEDRAINKSLPPMRSEKARELGSQRAETLPAGTEVDNDGTAKEGPALVTPQHVVGLIEASDDEILFLDLRVSTQYAQSKISGALNLCIPTTLLKRPSFNIHKLAETFKDAEHRQKFERWRHSRYIIVYDANTSQMKDAAICVNTLKKFASEGFSGYSYIIRGGFDDFAAKFPSLVVHGDGTSGAHPSADPGRPSVAPVVGGCPMPATKSAANPFFGNIRQNMDLIGGVGQLTLKHPDRMTQEMKQELPAWLRQAADPEDNGKLVADKFLAIEKKEQKRMQDALSGTVHYGTPTGGDSPRAPLSPSGIKRAPTGGRVQIAGVEKGSKNRYNNIWPFEHSRVKLQNVSDGDCDYVNANHVKASLSKHRYIATQGPIPATFPDFWNVIWQQDVRIIVMLTAEQEGGQVKAHNYWSSKKYGNLVLTYLSEHRASLEPERIRRHYSKDHIDEIRNKERPQTPRRATVMDTHATVKQEAGPVVSGEQPYVTVRRFTLARTDQPFQRMREITQLQYSHWPDFGAPAHPAHLLGLVEQCNAVRRSVTKASDSSRERPILVHCSAGCGRTGTFCTVDSVIDMLSMQRAQKEHSARAPREPTPMDVDAGNAKVTRPPADGHQAANLSAKDGDWLERDDVDLIEKTVEEFRLQRLSMVQSLRQFVLCYESVLEWLMTKTSTPSLN